MSYSPTTVNSCVNTKQGRKTKEEILYWEGHNKELVAEYKTASPRRRGEIFSEYYEGNKFFLTYWGRWEREHWAELTQIFVSYWHEAFMGYNPTSEKSVFNFYMDRKYKARASMAYRYWIRKESKNVDYEFSDDDTKKVRNVRKELFIHPQSDFDRSLLRTKLCRNLDKKEIDLVEKIFFENESLVDIVKDQFASKGKQFTVKQISQASYNFKKRTYESLLDKLYLNVSREDLETLASQNDEDHPPRMETIYNTKFRRERAAA
jgi:hypothetical protein